MAYRFQLVQAQEVPTVFALFEARIAWMEQKGLQQWNKTGYLSFYNLDYFESQQRQGQLYCLKNAEDAIVAAAVLLRQDARWQDRQEDPAWYVHNFVALPTVHGAGRQLLAEAERLAASQGMRCMRLDCPVNNEALNRYYEAQGYRLAGQCTAGSYHGNRREKIL